MSSKEIALTVQQGTFYLKQSLGFDLPSIVAQDKTFDMKTRARAYEEARVLHRELKAYSPLAQEWGKDHFMLFGSPDFYEDVPDPRPDAPSKIAGKRWRNPFAETTIKLSPSAANGIMWINYVSLIPRVVGPDAHGGNKTLHEPVPQDVATDICWAVAEKLGKVAALRHELGLDVPAGNLWPDDPAEALG